ncbi:MAG: pilus (MSHA type) biogenesis protein MshL [Gammaproteobacteria bacterium]|nr:pilus (MSHA type) biogenesis protein MshL [Gammaproteobacteria bacterium]
MNCLAKTSRDLLRAALLLALAMVLSACQSTPPRGGNVGHNIRDSLEESAQQQAAQNARAVLPPQAVTDALLPPLNVQLSGVAEAPLERRFDLTVNRTRARTFFMSLVQDTPYSMVVHPSVKGKVSLNLKNVTINEVMDTVRNVYGYEFTRRRHGFEVLPARLRSRIFTLDYLNVKRAGVSNVRVSSGQSTSNRNKSNTNRGASGSRNSARSNNADSGNNSGTESVSGSQVSTLSESNFWGELNTALSAIIGEKDGRNVVINPQSGIVVVRAMPAELRAVSEYLEATQNVIQRQVILEAKILEVELSDGYQSGINWAAIGRDGGNSVVAGQFGGSSVFDTGVSNLAGQSNALNPNNLTAINGDVASSFGGMFAMSLNLGDFTGFLELLESQGDVHVLSSPRVSTVNNQKAVIKVGTDEFFVTDVDTRSNIIGASTATNQSVNVELTPFFSGVALDVIPQISEDGVVTLHIHPSVSEVKERIKTISLTTNTQMRIPMALSTIRESDSIVRARSGQVVVIGGLMQNQTRSTTTKVPLLGDLPWIGSLFRHEKQVTRKSELVILLRPVVVNSDQTWTRELKRVTDRMNRLNTLSSSSVSDDDNAQ